MELASPGDLVTAVSRALGVPHVTVLQHDRNLAAAGLRSKGGRGSSAAKMMPADAAGLLIAAAASALTKDSADTLHEYGSLRKRGLQRSSAGRVDRRLGWSSSILPIPALIALPPDHDFASALAALVEASANGSLSAAIAELRDRKSADPYRPEVRRFFRLALEIRFAGPAPAASVTIRGATFIETVSYRSAAAGETSERSQRGMLRHEQWFGLQALLDVGACLSNGKRNDV